MKSSLQSIGPEFEPFLYASLGDEGNGMILSVLSTLARRDLDPWTEASELAALPHHVAAKRLTSIIAGPPGTASRVEAGAIADRLILLLPNHSHPTAPVNATNDAALGMTKAPLVVSIIVMCLIMGVQILSARLQTPTSAMQAPASTTAPSPTAKGPPPGPGQ